MKLSEINNILFRHSGKVIENSVVTVEQLLLQIYKNLDIVELIDSILMDAENLELIASNSYTHSIGFDKIVIHPYKNTDFQLRINAWWKDIPIHEYEQIHNHRWDFSTILLCGKYRYENYKIDEINGVEKFRYLYYPRENCEYTSLKYIKKEKIRLYVSGSLEKGVYMSNTHEIPHRILPEKGVNTFSLFLNNYPKTNHTDVYTDELLGSNFNKINVPNMSIIQLKERLQRIKNCLYLDSYAAKIV